MKQKKGFLSILLGTSGASLLRNLLAGKRAKHSNIPERRVMGAVKGTITADEGTISNNVSSFT